jgi:hypothetical protein
MSRLARSIGLICLVAGLSECAGPDPPVCAPGAGKKMAVFTLYLGEAIRGRPDLTEPEWRSFLDRAVTPAVPDGYTVLDGSGAWRNRATGATAQEATKILVVALPDTPDSLAAVNRIRAAYQTEFRQILVGMTVEQACATF